MNKVYIEMEKGTYTVAPDIIFNRFDLAYGTSRYVHITADTKEWSVPIRTEGNVAYLGLYLVDMPQDVFDKLISFVFKENRHVKRIY